MINIVRQPYQCRTCKSRDYETVATTGARRCPHCRRKRQRQHYERHTERVKAKARAYKTQFPEKVRDTALRSKYGIGLPVYEALLSRQRNSCAICEGAFDSSRPPNVDHHHGSGRVRGLLCNPCNRGIGLLKDSVEVISRAITYLEGAAS